MTDANNVFKYSFFKYLYLIYITLIYNHSHSTLHLMLKVIYFKLIEYVCNYFEFDSIELLLYQGPSASSRIFVIWMTLGHSRAATYTLQRDINWCTKGLTRYHVVDSSYVHKFLLKLVKLIRADSIRICISDLFYFLVECALEFGLDSCQGCSAHGMSDNKYTLEACWLNIILPNMAGM